MANKIEAQRYDLHRIVGSTLVVVGGILGAAEIYPAILTNGELKQLKSQTVPVPENAAEVEFARSYVTVYESTTRAMGTKGDVEKIPTLFDNKLIAKAYADKQEDDSRQAAWDINRTTQMLKAGDDQSRRLAVMLGGIILVGVGLLLGDHAKRNKPSSVNCQNGRSLEVNTTA